MTDQAGGRFHGVDRGTERRHLSGGAGWRCVQCKRVDLAPAEPERCSQCLGRTFAEVARG